MDPNISIRFLGVVAVCAALAACDKPAAPRKQPRPAPPVKVVTVQPRHMPFTLSFVTHPDNGRHPIGQRFASPTIGSKVKTTFRDSSSLRHRWRS
jgi:hypothetical protein